MNATYGRCLTDRAKRRAISSPAPLSLNDRSCPSGQNTPLPSRRSPPGSFKRLLGGTPREVRGHESWHPRRRIPMFVRFAILETPHVEPRRGIALRGIPGVLHVVYVRDHHEIALGHDRYDLGPHLLRERRGFHLPDLGEEFHHTLASRRSVWIVLDVALGQILVRQLPVPRLEQIFHDVVGGLRVRIELWVNTVEQGVRIARTDNRCLSMQGKAAGHEYGGE